MFKVVILAILISGCGIAERLAEDCGGELEQGCIALFGSDHTQTEDLARYVDMELRKLQKILNGMYAEINSNYSDQQRLELDVANLNSIIYQLQTEERIIERIDPCGDGPSFDEVILRSSSGALIAYFEQGGKRFLTQLPAGSYQTTDNQSCNFTINSSGKLCDVLGCR
ncbi:MAG: hypothetical protein FMNOHCHN_03771 [Ignavibacteriaceae bacterium]|nr:hypothetical protein [Ignavibacteriaceae bacterium]